MFDYRFVKVKNGQITDTMNSYARDGWSVVGLSANTVFGSSVSFYIVFERDSTYDGTGDLYEYVCLRPQGKHSTFMQDKSKAGWRVVAYTDASILGSSLLTFIVFKRKIR